MNTLTNDNVQRNLVRFRKCVRFCKMAALYMIAINKHVLALHGPFGLVYKINDFKFLTLVACHLGIDKQCRP